MEQEYKYKVCTVCLTYNQKPYIAETLRGFTMQDVSFPVVYCIVDDASTDGETDVLREWAEENLIFGEGSGAQWEKLDYGERLIASLKKNNNCLIVVILLKENHYQLKKATFPYFSEWYRLSKYISQCEGDDYWIDINKLKKEVEFLDNNLDYGMCCGGIQTLKGGQIITKPNSQSRIIGFENLLYHNSIATLTVLYRSDLFWKYHAEIDPYNRGWKMGDYPRWLWIASKSKVHHFDEVFGVYRVLEESASHSQDYRKRLAFLESARDIRLFFAEKYGLGNDVVTKINDVFYREKSMLVKGKDKHAYSDALKHISDKTFKERVKYILSVFSL